MTEQPSLSEALRRYAKKSTSLIKKLPAMQETWVRSFGQEDPLEKEVTTNSSILAWETPWTEDPVRLQSMVSQRVRHD